jgi:uncharacterized protein (DUF1330 family)
MASSSRRAVSALKIASQRVNETLVSHKARVLMDHGRFLILEGQGPVQGVTVYEFPTKDAALSRYDGEAYRRSDNIERRVQNIW